MISVQVCIFVALITHLSEIFIFDWSMFLCASFKSEGEKIEEETKNDVDGI